MANGNAQELTRVLNNLERSIKDLNSAAKKIGEGRQDGMRNAARGANGDLISDSSGDLASRFSKLGSEVDQLNKAYKNAQKRIQEGINATDKHTDHIRRLGTSLSDAFSPFRQETKILNKGLSTLESNISSLDISTQKTFENFFESMKEYGLHTDQFIVRSGQVNDLMIKMSSTLDEAIEKGSGVNGVYSKMQNDLEELRARGVDLTHMFDGSIVTVEELKKEFDQTATAFAKSTQDVVGTVDNEVNTRLGALGKSIDRAGEDLLAGFKAASVLFAQREGAGILELMRSGFRATDVGELGDLIWDAFQFGAAQEEAIRFARDYRQVLSGLTDQTSEVTNTLDAVDGAADRVRERFGLIGSEQLQMVGQGLNTLMNMGIEPSISNFDRYNETLRSVAAVSRMSAAEVSGAFEELAADPQMQRLAVILGEGALTAETLGKSFLNLQEAVGMNIDEFQQYRRWLAQQQQRDVPERFVQAGMRASLARQVGITGEDLEILRRGTISRARLGEDRGRFDEIIASFTRRLEQERGRLEREDITGLQSFIIRLQRAGLPEDLGAGLATRQQANVAGEVSRAQQERLRAVHQNTSAIENLTTRLTEVLAGVGKSPAGGFLGALGAVGGNVASGFLQGAFIKGAITGEGTMAAARSMLSGMGSGIMSGIRALGARGIGRIFLNTLKLGGIGTLITGLAKGFIDAFTFEGDFIEKTLTGMISTAEVITEFPFRFLGAFTDLFGTKINEFLDHVNLVDLLAETVSGWFGGGEELTREERLATVEQHLAEARRERREEVDKQVEAVNKMVDGIMQSKEVQERTLNEQKRSREEAQERENKKSTSRTNYVTRGSGNRGGIPSSTEDI